MNVNEILGKKIIDKQVKDLAKIAEMTFNTETFKISKIYGSVGNPLSKKYYSIDPSVVIAFGDYLQISLTKEELENEKLDKIPESNENDAKINEIIGKKVLNSKGNVTGKISGLNIDFENEIIAEIIVELPNSSSFSKKSTTIINKEDISGFGDYVLVNKDLEPEIKTETEEEPEEDSEEEEKVEVTID